ncbi:MAG: DMT family transporter [Geminicoccaceae bacterium]|nr:DMT family transporter [Geminicoccaceae bacterium]MCB9967415.1 DMT family transporter [Geminicoccaceae bacterium]HRY26083.1 DMT family transporter [Geminicoccaceae bacterium]
MDPEQRQVLIALGLVIAGGVLFVIMNTLVKFLTTELNPVMLTWARYFFHVAFVVVVFPKSLLGVLRADRIPFQIGRSVLLLLATITNFIALALLPLAEVASIIFLAPIFVAGLAVLVLRERVVAWRWLLIGLGFSGALIIVQPQGGTFGLGAAAALACAFFYALYQITTRIVREAQPIVSLLYGGLVGIVALSLVVPFYWQAPTVTQWLLFVSIGSLGAAGHLLVIMALQRAEASKMAPFTYVQLLWAMIASYVVFADLPSASTVIGAAVIVTSGLLLYRLDLAEAASRSAAKAA